MGDDTGDVKFMFWPCTINWVIERPKYSNLVLVHVTWEKNYDLGWKKFREEKFSSTLEAHELGTFLKNADVPRENSPAFFRKSRFE